MRKYWSEKDETTRKIKTVTVTDIIISLDGKSVSQYLVLSFYNFFSYTKLYLDPCLLHFYF